MAIYDQDLEYRKLNANKNAEILGALQAFGNFMNKRKELEQDAPLRKAQTDYYKAQANQRQNGQVFISGFDPITQQPIMNILPYGTKALPQNLNPNSSASKKNNFLMTSSLRKEFESLPEVKDYNVISPNIKSMDSLLAQAKSGTLKNYVGLDQGLITMFNKLTDPKSVVRESEFARTPENLPLINRISGAIDKIQAGGGGLTIDDREALVLASKIIVNERGSLFNQRLEEFNALADEYGFDKSQVTKNLSPFERYAIGNNQSQSGVVSSNPFDQSDSLSKQAAQILAKRRSKK